MTQSHGGAHPPKSHSNQGVIAPSAALAPPRRRSIVRPSGQELRDLTERMATCRVTRYGNLNVQTRVTARSKSSTFVVSEHPDRHNGQVIEPAIAQRMARLQDDYLRSRDTLVIDGSIGNDPLDRVAARLVVEASNANVAAMQQILYFPLQGDGRGFEPTLTVIDTPNLKADGFPGDRLITVDLERNVTRVFNSDYFGESKKGGLRMWNKIIYDRGGLAMHAGCKIIPVDGRDRVVLIIGLSGTGKTTTTFTRQNDSRPVQDDFLALMPDGRVLATENGCFAKTFGLSAATEPEIHGAVLRSTSYLENVSQKGADLDFFDTTHTQNGRAVFRMSDIETAGDARSIRRADILLILNRNEGVIPAVARLTGAQAAAYFMLGETRGTSAGGAEEAGRFLRIPGTNPFFPLDHSLQGNRFLELLRRHPMEVYLLNTGRVGGGEDDPRSLKVGIRHSSAVVKAIAEGTIRWESDTDFGYDVATHVPGIGGDDERLLRPRDLYRAQGRIDDYRAAVARLSDERRAYMRGFARLDPGIVEAVS